MVADSNDSHPFSFWHVTYTWFVFRISTLYLFIILSMKISKEKQSVIAISAGLLLIAWLKHSDIFLAIAIIILCSLPFTYVNTIIHKAWSGLSKILGTISSSCILFMLFYFFLTPISFLRKLFREKDMMRNFEGEKTSFFFLRNHLYNSKDFLNPW